MTKKISKQTFRNTYSLHLFQNLISANHNLRNENCYFQKITVEQSLTKKNQHLTSQKTQNFRHLHTFLLFQSKESIRTCTNNDSFSDTHFRNCISANIMERTVGFFLLRQDNARMFQNILKARVTG